DEYRNIKTVFSVHNLKFQGIYPGDMLGDVLGLADIKNAADQLTYGDAVNFMQGALNYSDKLTTVSPTYAEEICTPWYGEDMENIFLRRYDVLSGILNGIDTYKHSPGRDNNIAVKYNASTAKAGKAVNKEALQKELGLAVDPDVPLIVLISRLTEQKGLDLVKFILEELLEEDIQVAVLGVGDKDYEDAFKYFESIMPDKMRACIKFDLGLSARFYAGADMLLMPSRFEPCGLSQMIAMRYGTLPIVRETGGLKDTVIDCRNGDPEGCGFSFPDYNAHELLFAIKDAAQIYREDKKRWDALVKRAMKKDFSWKSSAKSYIGLYEQLMEAK
ncbi:MAG: glycogen/starch synthase, partial [Bacillota bacterium]|nr:glycogen/starch synthase [Bacillota bacterium]